ncbi:MAG: hypothetical protein IJQ39_12470 [Thermoguttaceae bacterium]|nr:hypothetical protein [Thermoguttaceae bacterium]
MTKIKNFLLALPLVGFSALTAFAEGESASGSTVTIPEELSGISFTDLISSLAGLVAPAIVGILGLVAGVWVVQFVWRKIRSTGR